MTLTDYIRSQLAHLTQIKYPGSPCFFEIDGKILKYSDHAWHDTHWYQIDWARLEQFHAYAFLTKEFSVNVYSSNQRIDIITPDQLPAPINTSDLLHLCQELSLAVPKLPEYQSILAKADELLTQPKPSKSFFAWKSVVHSLLRKDKITTPTCNALFDAWEIGQSPEDFCKQMRNT
jgi:hypothetical protein